MGEILPRTAHEHQRRWYVQSVCQSLDVQWVKDRWDHYLDRRIRQRDALSLRLWIAHKIDRDFRECFIQNCRMG